MGQNKDLIEQAFIGSYGANPTSGRRPLLVHFNGDPEIDELVDSEVNAAPYELVEQEFYEGDDFEFIDLELT